MAFSVLTYVSESALQAVIGGVVTTYPDEESLTVGINAATDAKFVVDKGIKFTLIDNHTLPDVLIVLGKGAEFTVVSGTP